jgi:integrase
MAADSTVKRRRSKGEGSLTRCKDGRWMGRYWVTKGDGTKKRQSIILKDRTAVLEKMRAEMTMADKGAPVLRDRRTTGEYLEYWLKFIAPNQIRPTTLELHTFITRKYLIPQLGKIPLTQLKPDHVRMMLNSMQFKGKGDRNLQRTRNTLSAALREALKSEYVTRNVARLVDPPKYRPPGKRTWTKEQVAQFLEYSQPHKYYPLFLLLLHYGLRRGEALGLRWQDIDFENQIIKIRQTLYEINHKPCFGLPKTQTSIRDLPMLPLVKQALLKHRGEQESYADDLVFHSEKRNPVNPRSLLTTFKSLAEKAGLPPLSLHEARHTAATLLARAWPNPKDVQIILGHSSITTTLGIYVDTNFEQANQALNAFAESVF